MISATIIDRAGDLLKSVGFLWTVITVVLLGTSFSWSSTVKEFDVPRSWGALGLAVLSLLATGVLLVLFGLVAVDSWTNDGDVEPVLVILNMATIILLGAAGISIVAIIRAVKHLQFIQQE